jgi:hypothetical protein
MKQQLVIGVIGFVLFTFFLNVGYVFSWATDAGGNDKYIMGGDAWDQRQQAEKKSYQKRTVEETIKKLVSYQKKNIIDLSNAAIPVLFGLQAINERILQEHNLPNKFCATFHPRRKENDSFVIESISLSPPAKDGKTEIVFLVTLSTAPQVQTITKDSNTRGDGRTRRTGRNIRSYSLGSSRDTLKISQYNRSGQLVKSYSSSGDTGSPTDIQTIKAAFTLWLPKEKVQELIERSKPAHINDLKQNHKRKIEYLNNAISKAKDDEMKESLSIKLSNEEKKLNHLIHAAAGEEFYLPMIARLSLTFALKTVHSENSQWQEWHEINKGACMDGEIVDYTLIPKASGEKEQTTTTTQPVKNE